MVKFWALFALMTLAVKTASSVKKWTYYKAEYTCKKERRSSRGTCDLGPHAYRGMKLDGPAWSVKFFFDDPQLFVESLWYDRMRRDATPLTRDEVATLEEAIHMDNRDPGSLQSFGYRKWEGPVISMAPPSDSSLNGNEDKRVYESDDDENYILSRTKASDHRFIGNG